MLNKKMNVLISIVILLIISSIFLSCSKNKEESKTPVGATKAVVSNTGIVKILPASTEFLAKFSSIEELYKYFSVTESSIFGEDIDNLDEVKRDLGFNPFNLSELKANGFSIDKEFGFAFDDFMVKKNGTISDDSYVNNEDIEFNGAFFLPITDIDKVVTVINKIIEMNSSKDYNSVSFNKVGDFYEFKVDNFTSYMVEKDGYLIFTVHPQEKDTKDYLINLISGKGKSLIASSTFSEVANKVGSGEELFFYANVKKILEKNIDEIKKFADDFNTSSAMGMPGIKANYDYIQSFEGAGIAIDLENKDFTAKSVLNVVKDSELLKLSKNVNYNKAISLGLENEPVFLTSFSVNAEEYFKMILSSLGDNENDQLTSAIDMVKSNYGLDIRKDLIEQLDGNLNLGVYDATSINMMNYNLLITLSVKDEAKFKKTLDDIIEKIVPPDQKQMISKQTVNGVEAYVYLAGFQQLYIGIKDKNVIVTIGKAMFEKALKADISNGFVNDLDDDYLKSILKSDTNVLYFNISEAYKVFNTFSGLLSGFLGAEDPKSAEKTKQDVKDVTEKFKYLLASSYVNNNSFHSDFILKTNFSKPFMIAVKELVDEKKK